MRNVESCEVHNRLIAAIVENTGYNWWWITNGNACKPPNSHNYLIYVDASKVEIRTPIPGFCGSVIKIWGVTFVNSSMDIWPWGWGGEELLEVNFDIVDPEFPDNIHRALERYLFITMNNPRPDMYCAKKLFELSK